MTACSCIESPQAGRNSVEQQHTRWRTQQSPGGGQRSATDSGQGYSGHGGYASSPGQAADSSPSQLQTPPATSPGQRAGGWRSLDKGSDPGPQRQQGWDHRGNAASAGASAPGSSAFEGSGVPPLGHGHQGAHQPEGNGQGGAARARGPAQTQTHSNGHGNGGGHMLAAPPVATASALGMSGAGAGGGAGGAHSKPSEPPLSHTSQVGAHASGYASGYAYPDSYLEERRPLRALFEEGSEMDPGPANPLAPPGYPFYHGLAPGLALGGLTQRAPAGAAGSASIIAGQQQPVRAELLAEIAAMEELRGEFVFTPDGGVVRRPASAAGSHRSSEGVGGGYYDSSQPPSPFRGPSPRGTGGGGLGGGGSPGFVPAAAGGSRGGGAAALPGPPAPPQQAVGHHQHSQQQQQAPRGGYQHASYGTAESPSAPAVSAHRPEFEPMSWVDWETP